MTSTKSQILVIVITQIRELETLITGLSHNTLRLISWFLMDWLQFKHCVFISSATLNKWQPPWTSFLAIKLIKLCLLRNIHIFITVTDYIISFSTFLYALQNEHNRGYLSDTGRQHSTLLKGQAPCLVACAWILGMPFTSYITLTSSLFHQCPQP